MRTFNTQEIKAIAVDVINLYPNCKKVAVTSDGMAFIIDEGDRAVINHATKNRYGKVLEISEFSRDELTVNSASDTNNSAANLIEQISAATTVEAVETLKASEATGKNRVTVITAADKKISELKAASEAALVQQINEAVTVEAVQAIKDAEVSGENKESIIAAADKKISELNPEEK
jgi:hypothetical protein